MTPILKIITQYCEQYVDDINLSELASIDAPLFARRMYGYFLPAISLFNLPAEMPEYLMGTQNNPRFHEPLFTSLSYITTQEYSGTFTIPLGDSYKGYGLCACRLKTVDYSGNVILTPIAVNYDSTTANATFNLAQGEKIENNSVLEFDFYTDGYFDENLSHEVMNILGMCFQVVWQDRFNTDWLSLVTKVEDKSFYEQNRANKERADTERLEMLRRKLAGEMRRFEQNCYYKKYVGSGRRLTL